jgi:hypothetical protein
VYSHYANNLFGILTIYQAFTRLQASKKLISPSGMHQGGVSMRKTTSLIFLILLLLATAAVVPIRAADKCDALKADLDAAWASYIEAEDNSAAAEESFRLALERQVAADNAYAEATRAVQKATAEWKTAVQQLYTCLAKRTATKCKIESQAVRDAFDAMKNAEQHQDEMALEIGAAQMSVDEARGNLKAAKGAAKAAREDYLKALAAFAACINVPRMS